MSGMEKTSSGGPSSRAFILRLFLWTALVPATLFWLSDKGYGLFSSEFMSPNETEKTAVGYQTLIDYTEITNHSNSWDLDINLSYLYFSLNRDTVTVKNLVPNFSFFIDAIFMPGFVNYDDAGVSNSIMPISSVIGSLAQFEVNRSLTLSFKGYFGFDWVYDYNYMFNFIYGVQGKVNYEVMKDMILGFSLGSTDFRYLQAEAGGLNRLSLLDIKYSFSLDGNYKIIKLGLEYPMTRNVSLFLGGNYTLEYNGWVVTGGVEFSHLNLFGLDSRIGCFTAYNYSGGFSFGLNYGVAFEPGK